VYLRRVSRSSPMHIRTRSRGKVAGMSMHFSPSAARVYTNLDGVTKLLLELANTGVRRVAIMATAELRKQTSQSLKSDKLARGWTLRSLGAHDIKKISGANLGVGNLVSAGHMMFGYGVYNSDDRAYAPIHLRNGYTTDLLEMLEYGTRPHRIYPKKRGSKRGGRLAFWWNEARLDLPIVGSTFFLGARGAAVSHPGTRPYGFTRIAVAKAAGDMMAVAVALRAVKFLVGSRIALPHWWARLGK